MCECVCVCLGVWGAKEQQETPDGRFALPWRVAGEVIKQPFHLRLLG